MTLQIVDEDELPEASGQPSVEQLMAVLQDLQNQNNQLALERDLADRECRRLRNEAHLLRTQLSAAQHADPAGAEVREVINYWRERCNKSERVKTPTGSTRWNKVKARLKEGYEVADLKLAIDGYATKPYVGTNGRTDDPENARRFDDIELICRDEVNVEKGIAMAPSQERLLRNVEAGRRSDEETPLEAVLGALHDAGHRLRPNGEERFLSTCPQCSGPLAIRATTTARGQVVGMDCMGAPPCDREQIIFTLGLVGSDLVQTRAVLNEYPAPVQLPEHLRTAMEQLLERGVP